MTPYEGSKLASVSTFILITVPLFHSFSRLYYYEGKESLGMGPIPAHHWYRFFGSISPIPQSELAATRSKSIRRYVT